MRATAIVLPLFACACLAAPSYAQDGPVYVGGSFLLVTSSAPPPDPTGAGYLRPNFHGSLEWPVVGVGINAGVFFRGHWDGRGELALRRTASARISEEEQSGHFEFRRLSSRYESSEGLLSLMVGRRIRAGSKVDLHPVGGFNVSFATQKMKDRRGTYSYPGGTLPSDAPDVSVQTTRYGFGGGADLVITSSSSVAFVGGARLLWFGQPTTPVNLERSVPALGSYVLHLAAGVKWRR